MESIPNWQCYRVGSRFSLRMELWGTPAFSPSTTTQKWLSMKKQETELNIIATIKKSTFKQEDLKPYWKPEKNISFITVINYRIIYKLYKILLRTKKKAYKTVKFSQRPLLNIVKHRDHRWNSYDFRQKWLPYLDQVHTHISLELP